MLFAAAPAILTRAFPAKRRGEVLGIQLTVATLGMTAGPLLAGLLADSFGWPAVFFASVPPAVVSLALAPRLVPADVLEHGRLSIDVAGGMTFGLGLTGLLLMLNQASVWGWMSLPSLVGGLASVALLVAFVGVERSSPTPMLDLELFRQSDLSAATIGAMANYIGLSSILVLVPLYLIEVRHLDATQAGLFLGTQPLARTFIGPLSGYLSDRIGTRLPSLIGLAVFGLGLLLMMWLAADSSLMYLIVCLLVAGVGAGLFLTPNTSAIMSAVPRHQQGVASGLVSTTRNIGIAVGVVASSAWISAVAGTQPSAEALVPGIRAGFGMAALVVGLAVCLTGVVTPPGRRRS